MAGTRVWAIAVVLLLSSVSLAQQPVLSGVSSFEGPYSSEQEAYHAVYTDLWEGYSLAYFVYGDRLEYSHGWINTFEDDYGDWYAHGQLWYWINP